MQGTEDMVFPTQGMRILSAMLHFVGMCVPDTVGVDPHAFCNYADAVLIDN
jgi:hypothetical protein